MHFCPKCGNMYYLQLKKDDEDKLIYYCRNCGNEDETLVSNNNLYVSQTNIKKQMNYKNSINKYTKLDPTLPRINNIDCPNLDCDCNKFKEGTEEPLVEKEILYIRYDDANMKFVYLCAHCDTVWNTTSK